MIDISFLNCFFQLFYMLPQNILILEVDVDKNNHELKPKIEKIIINFIDEKKVKFSKKDVDSRIDKLVFSFIVDEEKINSGYLEKNIGKLEGVKSVEIVNVKRISG